MKPLAFVAAVCLLGVGLVSALPGAQREEYPRPPNHKLLFENTLVRVFDIRITPGTWAFGDVRWAEPVVHSARNVGTTEQRVVRIELK